MHPRLALLAALGLGSSTVFAQQRVRRSASSFSLPSHPPIQGRAGSDDVSSTSPSSTSSASSAASSGVTGGSICPTGVLGNSGLMCISGVINGTTTRYTLQSQSESFGWMAIGFGKTMANSPMVMMWTNSDGSITVSQRQASGEVPPSPVSNPPRVATVDQANSNLAGSQPSLSFTIEVRERALTTVDIIWAFSDTNPGSSDNTTRLSTGDIHVDSGPAQLDLSQPVSSNGTVASSGSGTVDVPLVPFQKMIVAHAVLATIGFLILLPAGAILARYARTFTGVWFVGHWLFQLVFAGPVIIAGVALGFAATDAGSGETLLPKNHKATGVSLIGLYVFQCALGIVIHYWKPASFTVSKKRPIQNYAHAVLGLTIIGLAFWQVHTGYALAWPATSGRPALSSSVNTAWLAWVVIIPVLYFAGLAFLPKQFRQERPAQKQEVYADEPRYTDS
ncbi:uncharacterized protein BXZ73DRAFT_47488 [Epithele typhae]|uniref:uncharacterized protein n=1 Tax=Epithele typhae TaxID=378194 RepID=UPI0020081A51|nr:uncharacterized protein BXZ73DRAFT_47488 [Epithele typhae]KAH9931172.1 hypothetical protein BXZ73DRAFT_47488 [Epithele typhae]